MTRTSKGKIFGLICLAMIIVRMGPAAVRRHMSNRQKMRQVTETESSEDHYDADTWTLTCIDDRFTEAIEELEKSQEWTHIDRVKWAGGAKGLASADPIHPTPEALEMVNQIGLSIALHKTKRIALFIHEACGAYGAAMPKDHEAALAFMATELRKAKAVILARGIKRRIHMFAVGFDGVHEVDPIPLPDP